MNKKVLIGVGVLAAAGLAYYLWKKNKDASTEGKEEKANAIGRFSTSGSMLTPRVAPVIAPIGTVGTVSGTNLRNYPAPLGIKKGYKKLFGEGTRKAECCVWLGDAWRCTSAPCTLGTI